jgi:hypothetical protein
VCFRSTILLLQITFQNLFFVILLPLNYETFYMGNSLVRWLRPLKDLRSITRASREDFYDADAEDEGRHANSAAGFKIEDTGRHSALAHTRTFRKACFLSTLSSEGADQVCDIKVCTAGQDFVDSLLASDDRCKIVAAIGNVHTLPTILLRHAFDTYCFIFSRNYQQFCFRGLL